MGLSPRVRGSRTRSPTISRSTGSIPAGAGQPYASCTSPEPATVYPRGCGAANFRLDWFSERPGLSPRVRGSRLRPQARATPARSIPAGAGQPTRCGNCTASGTVYPRGCGAATAFVAWRASAMGLSPRVRGSPIRRRLHSQRQRSIPAGAGQPEEKVKRAKDYGVYPRGCGAADARQVELPISSRSIPAGAGQPAPSFN